MQKTRKRFVVCNRPKLVSCIKIRFQKSEVKKIADKNKNIGSLPLKFDLSNAQAALLDLKRSGKW